MELFSLWFIHIRIFHKLQIKCSSTKPLGVFLYTPLSTTTFNFMVFKLVIHKVYKLNYLLLLELFKTFHKLGVGFSYMLFIPIVVVLGIDNLISKQVRFTDKNVVIS